MDAHELAVAIPPGLCTEGAGSDAYLPIFPWKGFDYTLYKVLPKGSASN